MIFYLLELTRDNSFTANAKYSQEKATKNVSSFGRKNENKCVQTESSALYRMLPTTGPIFCHIKETIRLDQHQPSVEGSMINGSSDNAKSTQFNLLNNIDFELRITFR